jgi:hypothetical protein
MDRRCSPPPGLALPDASPYGPGQGSSAPRLLQQLLVASPPHGDEVRRPQPAATHSPIGIGTSEACAARRCRSPVGSSCQPKTEPDLRWAGPHYPPPGLTLRALPDNVPPQLLPEELTMAQPQYISALRRSAVAILANSQASSSDASPRQAAVEILSQWRRAYLAEEFAICGQALDPDATSRHVSPRSYPGLNPRPLECVASPPCGSADDCNPLAASRAARIRAFRTQGRHAAALMDSMITSGQVDFWHSAIEAESGA